MNNFKLQYFILKLQRENFQMSEKVTFYNTEMAFEFELCDWSVTIILFFDCFIATAIRKSDKILHAPLIL